MAQVKVAVVAKVAVEAIALQDVLLALVARETPTLEVGCVAGLGGAPQSASGPPRRVEAQFQDWVPGSDYAEPPAPVAQETEG